MSAPQSDLFNDLILREREVKVKEWLGDTEDGGANGKEAYRYGLSKIWNNRQDANVLMMIGCNPSTSNAFASDPTMDQVVDIARNNGYDGVHMCNLFAYRDPKPEVMKEIARVLKPGGLFVMADSAQFGDTPELDGILEYFPEGFHEPYYKGYLSYDFAPIMHAAGFVPERKNMAFLTKITTWRATAA